MKCSLASENTYPRMQIWLSDYAYDLGKVLLCIESLNNWFTVQL
jgi:hypothetical protein